MFSWLFTNRRTSAPLTPKSAIREIAMRASIAVKLRNYNAEEDTTISEFSLVGDKKSVGTTSKITLNTDYDVWGKANPGETGKWNKEIRQNRQRMMGIGKRSTKPR
jgi:hypothetical protein